jgi:hypothetical protein
MPEEAEVGLGKAEIEYLRRSFTVVDGLWFVKVEEAYGFDAALELDHRVWQIMGKIQARTAREVLGLESNDFDALTACLQLKFSAEDFEAEMRRAEGKTLEVSLSSCPWLEILKKASRLHLAKIIADKICKAEYGAWAKEFDKQLQFSPGASLCTGAGACRIRFME